MSSYSKPPFSPVHSRQQEYDKRPFPKIYSLESVSKTIVFGDQKRPYFSDREAKTVKKVSVFENMWVRVAGALKVDLL